MEPLEIIHEDPAIVVVVKPAGIATANVPAGEASVFTMLRDILSRRVGSVAGFPFLGVVSRLDRPVSGVAVFARSSAAAAALAAQFRDRTVEKTYFALVEGRFPGALDAWVDWSDTLVRPRHGRSRARRDGDDAPGQPARIRARVLRRLGEVSLVELQPASGRRHQIRAQLADRGCPIVGDRRYGARLPFPAGIALHARSLAFEHPDTGRRVAFSAPFPASWQGRFAAAIAGVAPPAAVDSPSAPRGAGRPS